MTDVDRIRERFSKDFIFYGESILKIRPKEGGLIPLKLNRAQLYLHEKAEEQLQRTGKVRLLVPKARQGGISTYITARFYHKVTHTVGYRGFILTHEAEATSNLFDMVKRYHDNIEPMFRVSTGSDSMKELNFDKLDSGYKVGTAGNKQTGRSSTIQLFHGSEVAFWINDKDIAAGALQAIPDEAGTESILESTGNGIGNLFYKMCMDAIKGLNDYEVVFIPWFWMENYYKQQPESFVLTDEERELKRLYLLNEGQLYWRRAKIAELGSESLFRQEYPATLMECFQASSEESFISPDPVMRARKTVLNEDRTLPMVVGIDPARHGGDRTAIVYRRGRKLINIEIFKNSDLMEVVGKTVQIIRSHQPAKIFLDVGGLGWGIYDRLKELGHSDIVSGINSGEKAIEYDKYANKRAEMWGIMRQWLESEPCDIPDEDEILMDLTCPSYKYDSNTRLLLEKKEDIKKSGRKSPDIGDALALTFAFPVLTNHINYANLNSAGSGRVFL